MLMVAVGIAGWAWGKTQTESASAGYGARGTGGPGGPGYPGHDSQGGAPGPQPSGAGANGGAAGGPNMSGTEGPRPKPTWQRANTGPAGSGTAGARSGWEKAREETRRKEEERRRKEEAEKKAREAAWERARTREREARERQAREAKEREARERETREREAREKEEREAREREVREKEARERENREKEAKEKEIKEAKEREAREARGKEALERAKAREREREERERRERASPRKETPTPTPTTPKRQHQQPTARTYKGTEDEEYSFRPYDKPKQSRPMYKDPSQSSIYSESSYAPSQSTARTTPPPSHRGPYSTKDPDKIVIKAVYQFSNAFSKVPVAQLVSGVGSVTDGLILKITTEGLFIDDDVRGVPQREWDVKAWTMKLVEVWCPSMYAAGVTAPSSSPRNTQKRTTHHHHHSSFPFLFNVEGSKSRAATAEETDQFVALLLETCKSNCQPKSLTNAPIKQTGEFKGLHVLRATIRDQDSRKYVFILEEMENWKVAIGLQRLRRGTQVRALGVQGLSMAETRGLLEGLGWS